MFEVDKLDTIKKKVLMFKWIWEYLIYGEVRK